MPVKNLPLRFRAKRGFPLLATALGASLSVTTVSLQAAGNDPSGASARFDASACEVGVTDIGPADSASEVRICGRPGQGQRSQPGEELGAAARAEAAKAAIHSHARMPELLSLRLMAARTEADAAMPAVDRLHTLTGINRKIVSLELEISQAAQSH
jgi:hypothetical protein